MGWLKALLAWIFPFYCLGCDKLDETICEKCLRGINFNCELVCPYCLGISDGRGATCEQCLTRVDVGNFRGKVCLDFLGAAVRYDSGSLVVKGLFELKYGFRREFEEPLSWVLAKLLDQLNWDLDSVVIGYIPIHSKKMVVRGFNQAELLANSLNEIFMKKFEVRDLLIRKTYTHAQMTLKKVERLENVAGAFGIREGVSMPEKVLLIDDVATTLATINEAAGVLKAAGAKKVYGLVLARQLLD